MTREEAIGKWIYPAIATMWDKNKCNEILEAIEQEPCEDAISRQAVLDIAKSSKSNWIDNSVLFKRVNELPSVSSQEPNGDVISREAVIEGLNTINGTAELDKAFEVIEHIPSVNLQESKTGHWIGHREHCENLGVVPTGLGAYEWCSNCDCGIDVREWHRTKYNYCPNCGAKMQGDVKYE